MKTVHAIYENGVFRPEIPVELPEHCRVAFEPRMLAETDEKPSLDDVYAVLNQRFASGESDVAARHDEHQP